MRSFAAASLFLSFSDFVSLTAICPPFFVKNWIASMYKPVRMYLEGTYQVSNLRYKWYNKQHWAQIMPELSKKQRKKVMCLQDMICLTTLVEHLEHQKKTSNANQGGWKEGRIFTWERHKEQHDWGGHTEVQMVVAHKEYQQILQCWFLQSENGTTTHLFSPF